MKKQKNKQGFTLVELLLYVSIMGTLVLTISSFMNAVSQAKEKNQIISEIEQQGINITQLLNQNIKAAANITAPLPGVSGSSLTLSFSDASRNPTVFKLVGSGLMINLAGGSDIALTNSKVTVTNFLCANYGKTGAPDSINCRFTLSAVDSFGRSEYSYTKNFNMSVSHRY
ncbi:MAG: PulJ/GspJ family protein [Patescibacteria group bacterium]